MIRNSIILLVFCAFGTFLNAIGAVTGDGETTSGQHFDAAIQWQMPTVLIVTLLRNKAHTLPHFFSYLDRQDYPKHRISLWLRSDHNEDNTNDVLHTWMYKSSHLYHNVDVEVEEEPKQWANTTSLFHWPDERHAHIISLKEESLNYARRIWADYVFFLDADVLLTNPTVLTQLVELNRPIVSPMVVSDGLYSNFWCGMTEDYYYQRTDDYMKIYNYEKRGEYPVPMVHSAILINLNDVRSDQLTFNRTVLIERFAIGDSEKVNIPLDDIIIFALSANYSGIPLVITNYEMFGFILAPLDPMDSIEKDKLQMINTKIMIINDSNNKNSLSVLPELERFVEYPTQDSLTVDKIFMINLLRRPERRIRMERSFKELGLIVEHIAAVDGQQLTDAFLEELEVRFLPGYADPYHNRPMTLGEIGCFLSHFMIWEKIVMEELNEVLVLEDDIRFEPFFRERARSLLREARQIGGWDLIYFGRKRLDQDEFWVKGSDQLVYAGYSYWTLGYVLTLDGAKKLLAANPLQNLVPVDEYIPIMFGQHFNHTWKQAFESNEKLTAWSAAPLILFPTRYTGEEGYISDTEESDLIQVEKCEKKKKGNKENLEHAVTNQKMIDEHDSGSCPASDLENCLANTIESVTEQASLTKSKDHYTEL